MICEIDLTLWPCFLFLLVYNTEQLPSYSLMLTNTQHAVVYDKLTYNSPRWEIENSENILIIVEIVVM